MDYTLTGEQVRRVDRMAMEEYGLLGLVLMENAGRNAANVILDDLASGRLINADTAVSRVLIYCGTGNNGGDGFVVARHLANAGREVGIVLVGSIDRLSPDAAANHRICAAMGISMTKPQRVEVGSGDLVVDAMLGTGFAGPVRAPMAKVIHGINEAARAAVVAIDVPSGLNCDTGVASNACIIADLTITFVARKVGFRTKQAKRYIGRVEVVDIGVPKAIVERVTKT